MKGHTVKFQPVTLFGKLVGASLFLTWPLTWAEPVPTSLSGTATSQLKNSDSPQNLSGMDLAIAPPSLVPEIRRMQRNAVASRAGVDDPWYGRHAHALRRWLRRKSWWGL